MIQLLTYCSPARCFNAEHALLARIQVDNALSLGWRPDDILLATNFPWRYRGVEARQVPDCLYCRPCWPATKVACIEWLLQRGVIDEPCWYHDFDCYQLHPFDEDPLGPADLAATNYGRVSRLCSASMFFGPTALDIFTGLRQTTERTGCNEEVSLAWLLRGSPAMARRFRLLNCTYALNRANIRPNYAAADKPLKAAHFHLSADKYRQFVLGQTVLGFPLVPQRLIDIFTDNGWTGQQEHVDA